MSDEEIMERLKKCVDSIRAGVYVSRSTLTDLLVDIYENVREEKQE